MPNDCKRFVTKLRALGSDSQNWTMVPAERIELPTFGLQNRCTTAVLRRLGDWPSRHVPQAAFYPLATAISNRTAPLRHR